MGWTGRLGFTYVHYWLFSLFRRSAVSDSSMTPWTVAHQAPSVRGISRARILERVAISFSGGIFLMQGSNPCLVPWQADSGPPSRQGSPGYWCHVQSRWLMRTHHRVLGTLLSALQWPKWEGHRKRGAYLYTRVTESLCCTAELTQPLFSKERRQQ